VAEELQGGEAAGRRHVEMLPAARGYDKAFCCAHVGVLPCSGMRINASTMNINVHESRSSRLELPAHRFDALVRASVHYYNDESEVERFVRRQPPLVDEEVVAVAESIERLHARRISRECIARRTWRGARHALRSGCSDFAPMRPLVRAKHEQERRMNRKDRSTAIRAPVRIAPSGTATSLAR
jgi:hypothetical protein